MSICVTNKDEMNMKKSIITMMFALVTMAELAQTKPAWSVCLSSAKR